MYVFFYLSRQSGVQYGGGSFVVPARGPVLSAEPVWGRAEMLKWMCNIRLGLEIFIPRIRQFATCYTKRTFWCDKFKDMQVAHAQNLKEDYKTLNQSMFNALIGHNYNQEIVRIIIGL